MAYVVYENRVHNYARVHIVNCAFVKMHGGVSSVISPTGRYYEGFETPEDALNKARSTGRDIRICSNCSPLLLR